VGLFQPNAPADVIRAKRQLASAGHLLGGRARVFDGRADEGQISAIGTFQLENGLTHDNFLLPGGETQRALDSRPRPAANPFARLAIPLAGEADPAEPPPEDDTPRDEAPERENPEREDPDRESPERDDPGGDGPGADRDPREEQEAAVPLFIVLLAAELGLAVMFVYGIYLSMSREDFDDWVAEMRRRKRERGEEDEEEEDSSLSEDRLNNRRCNDRWQREMILCEKRPWEWREGGKRRAGDRLRLCIRHGYPGPKKPARWRLA
jgi:hypothetical protein